MPSVVKDDVIQELEDKDLMLLIMKIMTLYLNYDDENAVFKPMLVWQDGSRSFDMSDLTDKDKDILSQIEYDLLPLPVRAQVCDLIWQTEKKHVAAQKAADSYYELYDATLDTENWSRCINMIKRAINLAARLNDNGRKDRYLIRIYDDVVRTCGQDKLFYSIHLISLLVRYNYNYDFNKLLSITNNLIAADKENTIRLQESYKIKATLQRKHGDNDDAKATMIAYANELVHMADTREAGTINDVFVAEHYLQNAIQCLQDYGQNADEVSKKLLALQKKITKGLTEHTHTFDVSDVYNMLKKRYSVEYSKCLTLLAIDIPWMEQEKIKREVIDNVKMHPFQNLFAKTMLNPEGNVISFIPTIDITNPEANQSALLANMYYQAKQDEELHAQLSLNTILGLIRMREEFTEDSLDFIVNNNAIIPSGRERIFRTGIYLGIKGNYYEALHILAPQVENLFRHIAEACGDVVIGYKNGIQQAHVLGSIFEMDNLKMCYDENILFTFQGLMEKKEGSNIRNLIAHGLMGEQEISFSCIYFICAVYKLLYYNSRNALKCFVELKDEP